MVQVDNHETLESLAASFELIHNAAINPIRYDIGASCFSRIGASK